jgi:hypothetical protein
VAQAGSVLGQGCVEDRANSTCNAKTITKKQQGSLAPTHCTLRFGDDTRSDDQGERHE